MQKPIIPADLYRGIRDSQLIGMPGYTKDVSLLFVHIGCPTPFCEWCLIAWYLLITSNLYLGQGHPVFAIGVGLSTYDKASVSFVRFCIIDHWCLG